MNYKNGIFSFFIFFGISILLEAFISYFFSWRPKIMSFNLAFSFLWGGIGFICFVFLKNILTRFLVYILFFIYEIGNVNSVASYYLYGRHYLTDLQSTNCIYIFYCYLFVVGLYFGDKYIADDKMTIEFSMLKKGNLSDIFSICVFLFPFFWFLDQYKAIGYVPILSGSSLIDDMYNISYGSLYGYGVILTFCCLFSWSHLFSIKRKFDFISVILLIFVGFSFFSMMFDGRRIYILIFIAALLVFELVRSGNRNILTLFGRFGGAMLCLYIIMLYVRQGGRIVSYIDPAQTLSKVGVEYRDFAYVVTHLMPGSLSNYSWFGSSVGGALNWGVLALLGFNKGELVLSGSAYQLSHIFNSDFGIRIGLFGELWLEYGLGGGLIAFVLGFIFVWISSFVYKSITLYSRVSFSIVFGIAIFSFVGQSSAITGYWSLLAYLSLFWFLLDLFRNEKCK